MAQDRVLGEQLDLIDITGDIAADATAIGNLASGIAADPTAASDLAGGIDHTDIGAGAGVNTHSQIDIHIDDTSLHFSTMDGLSDVDATTPTDRDVLVWQNGSTTWIPGVRVENPMISNLDVDGFSIITAGVSTGVNNNNIILQAGANSYASGYKNSGGVNIYGGNGTNKNYGGAINIKAGATDSIVGSNVTIYGGEGNYVAFGGDAGQVNIYGGRGNASGTDGGSVGLIGGFSNSGKGGSAHLTGGNSNSTTGLGGGDAFVTGGTNLNNTTPQNGGNVNITGGKTQAGGVSGSVTITAAGESNNTAGSVNINVPGGAGTAGTASIKIYSTTLRSIELKSPASIPADRTWVLPQDDPTIVAGYALTTDASGVLSFAPPEYVPLTISADVTTSRSLVLSDTGQMVTMNNAAANEVVIPTNASVAFVIGTEIVISQFGTGQTSFVGEGSPTTVTINSAGGLTSLAEQFSTATIVKTGTDTWLLSGDTV